MSRVFKRFTFLADGGHVGRCYYLLSASLSSRYYLSSGVVKRNEPTSHLGRRSNCVNIDCAFGRVGNQLDSKRSMSILTDLLRRKKKDEVEDEDEAIPEAKTLTLFEDPPKALTEEEILTKRDVSRLNPHHRRLVNGQHPYVEPMMWIHHTVRYKQRMFGKYGESSGVNPGIIWDTREDLALRKEYESIAYPFTIQEMVEKRRLLRLQEKEAKDQRAMEVDKKMAMVDKYKEDLAKRMEEKERETNEAKARREKLMEEVRRHFGFNVDYRDERFQEMLEKKEKEQRKQMKEARKLEKQQKILQKLEKQAEKENQKEKSEKKGKKGEEAATSKKKVDDEED